jgi:hypothetical protein
MSCFVCHVLLPPFLLYKGTQPRVAWPQAAVPHYLNLSRAGLRPRPYICNVRQEWGIGKGKFDIFVKIHIVV